MEFIFWFENLNIKGTIGSKVFCSPSSQNCLVILQNPKKEKVQELWVLWKLNTQYLVGLPIKPGYHLKPPLLFANLRRESSVKRKLLHWHYSFWMFPPENLCFMRFLLLWLTAAVRSTSFLLLRMKQASASSILKIGRKQKKSDRDRSKS